MEIKIPKKNTDTGFVVHLSIPSVLGRRKEISEFQDHHCTQLNALYRSVQPSFMWASALTSGGLQANETETRSRPHQIASISLLNISSRTRYDY